MKVYLAASWTRQDEIRELACELRAIGVQVTSTWLDEPVEDARIGKEKRLTRNGLQDLADIRTADVFARISDNHKGLLRAENRGLMMIPANLSTGGRMVETGYAIAIGKPFYLVGDRENIFDYLPQVIRIRDQEHLKRELSPEEVH